VIFNDNLLAHWTNFSGESPQRSPKGGSNISWALVELDSAATTKMLKLQFNIFNLIG
jgi:hypothetical protein